MSGLSHLFNALDVPPLLLHFILTMILSFAIGLELHSYRRANNQDLGFGTTRTFVLIGVFGFVLFVLDESPLFYAGGFVALVGWLTVFYHSQSKQHHYSLISPLMAVMTYLVPPIVVLQPNWFAVLFVVTLLLILGEKSSIRRFSDAFHSVEIVTFSKYLIMTGVILPLLPERQVFAPYVTVTFYQIWLALLVVSSLSYISYLMQTYWFKERGLLFSGLLGGLYSSTATTIVLARRSREIGSSYQIANSIILATVMMYLRLLLLIVFLGHSREALALIAPFSLFMGSLLLAVAYITYTGKRQTTDNSDTPISHPLEFRTATIFAILFVIFAAVTQYVIGQYGNSGLSVMSFAVGFIDIDPFILSLLAGKYAVTSEQIIAAVIIATASNNLMKAGYAAGMGRNRATLFAAGFLLMSSLLSFAYAAWLL